jgi:hypothetical protein
MNRAGVGTKTLAGWTAGCSLAGARRRARSLLRAELSISRFGAIWRLPVADSTERHHRGSESAKNTQCDGHDPQRVFEQLQVALVYDRSDVMWGGLQPRWLASGGEHGTRRALE